MTASLERAPRSRRRVDTPSLGPVLVPNPAPTTRPEAVALLAEILARLKGFDLPVVQFVAACPQCDAGELAHDVAIASVARFGRTLLLSPVVTDRGVVVNQLRPVRSTQPSARSPLPDAGVPGLYHRWIDEESFDAAQVAIPATRSGSQPFRMVLLSSPPPSLSPATLMQASHAHGTIIAVAAGITPLRAIRATVRQVRHAGGTLLGTVLTGAQPRDPWR